MADAWLGQEEAGTRKSMRITVDVLAIVGALAIVVALGAIVLNKIFTKLFSKMD